MADPRRAPNMRILRDKPAVDLPAAVDACLSQAGLSAQTRRSYRLTLAALTAALDETAGRANEALALNVEDLDVPNRRAAIRGKNGELDYLHWHTGAGHLLSRLVVGRPTGLVFLTDRRASAPRPATAICARPHTGRARLSYRRAQEFFCEVTGGWTLHQLRHYALTHLAEANVGLPLLMAKSRHASLHSLQKYARPGVDAVARLTCRPRPGTPAGMACPLGPMTGWRTR